MKKNVHKKTAGFTLIEALVALGIFSVVVVSCSGVILSIISSNKQNQSVSSVVNNLNYSIESMVRDIKTGYKYQCDYDIDSGTNATLDTYKESLSTCVGSMPTNSITLISTITGKEQIVRYEMAGFGEDVYIQKTLYDENGGAPVQYPLTDARNISITTLRFVVTTPSPLIPGGGTVGQPSVFLILSGTAKVNKINISDFFIQTYISQRLPNFI